MKEKSIFRVILGVLLVVAFIAITLGGGLYYSFIYPDVTWGQLWSMTIQNSIQCILFDPILSIGEMLGDQEFWNFLPTTGKITMWCYVVSVIAAPILDILIVLSVFDEFLKFFANFTFKKKRILVIGYNDHVKQMLSTRIKDAKVYLMVDTVLQDEEERNLLFHGVSVRRNLLSELDVAKKVRSTNSFLASKKITDVILVEESDTRNIQDYMTLASSEICKKRTIHFYTMNRIYENRNSLQDYFDQTMEAAKSNADTHMDLRIFNYPQVQAEMLFRDLPLYSYNIRMRNGHSDVLRAGAVNDCKNMDVHMLVIGGGSIGEAIILHAMNQGVFTPENRITIDVIDKDIKSIARRLHDRFDGGFIVYDEGAQTFSIPDGRADGKLLIRLTETDVYDKDIVPTIKSLEDEGEITYVAVCLPESDNNLYCAHVLKKCFDGNEQGLPVAFSMSYSTQMEQFFESFKCFYDVYFMGENGEYIGLDNIINSTQEKMIRRFNMTYNSTVDSKIFAVGQVDSSNEGKLVTASDEEIEAAWNKLEYYKRQSNRALYFHSTVKADLFPECKEEMRHFWDDEAESGVDTSGDSGLAWSLRLISREKDGEPVYPELLKMAMTEHRRWCYFFASEGWGYNVIKSPANRVNDCMCTWEDLIGLRPDTLIYDLISSPLLVEVEE